MMLILELCFRFFCCGLFAIGGGLATLPFLYNISKETGWYTFNDISNMIAVSESTPGPIPRKILMASASRMRLRAMR